jgi:hypothetical protein
MSNFYVIYQNLIQFPLTFCLLSQMYAWLTGFWTQPERNSVLGVHMQDFECLICDGHFHNMNGRGAQSWKEAATHLLMKVVR